MDGVNLAVAVVSMIAGLAAAYFAWREHAKRRDGSRRNPPASGSPGRAAGAAGSSGTGSDVKDVFISYAHEDGEWVKELAVRLEAAGLDVFLDKWDITPGDQVVHQLDDAVRASVNSAIQVFSPISVDKPWVRQEYSALLTASVERGLRFIPVLYAAPGPDDRVEIPPFAATRLWLDFRKLTGAAYDQKVNELVRAIRGEKPERV